MGVDEKPHATDKVLSKARCIQYLQLPYIKICASINEVLRAQQCPPTNGAAIYSGATVRGSYAGGRTSGLDGRLDRESKIIDWHFSGN
jgi:hypothetical protein